MNKKPEQGLNGNPVLRDLVLSLIDGGCSVFIETGTFKGETCAWIRKRRDIPIFTCELNRKRAVAVAEKFTDTQVKFYEMASPQFLDAIQSQIRGLPLIFLDAHAGGDGYKFWPITSEIKCLASDSFYYKAVIIVHDFKVPRVPKFRAQHHPDGTYLDLDYIKPLLSTEPDFTYRFYFPIHYVPGKSGYICIFQNVEPFGLALDTEQFYEQPSRVIEDANGKRHLEFE